LQTFKSLSSIRGNQALPPRFVLKIDNINALILPLIRILLRVKKMSALYSPSSFFKVSEFIFSLPTAVGTWANHFHFNAAHVQISASRTKNEPRQPPIRLTEEFQ